MRIDGASAEEHAGIPGAGRNGLAEAIARWTRGVALCETAIPGLSLHRWDAPTEPTSYLLGPSICLIGQGRKRVLLGDEVHVYDAHGFLLTSVDLPLTAQIVEASVERPYLGLTLALDLRTVARLILEHPAPISRTPEDRLGLAVGRVSPPLLGAFLRLLDLLAQPQDIPALSPLILQEICYRLLVGEQGARLRRIVSAESHAYRVARAIDWIKDNFRESFRIEDLAALAGLSASAFHVHFRAMTAMSPLQFQKKMRLSEARRLMFAEHADASTAAFAVGYESPSQFSREYARLFGTPPRRDIRSLSGIPAD